MKHLLPLVFAAATLICSPAQAQDIAGSTGVVSSASVPPPPDGKGQVVFFRKTSMGGMPYAFTIKDGDKPVTKLRNGRYFVYVTDPGAHEFSVRGEAKDSLFLEVEAGETYFIEQTMVMGMFYYANLAPSREEVFATASLRQGAAAE